MKHFKLCESVPTYHSNPRMICFNFRKWVCWWQ